MKIRMKGYTFNLSEPFQAGTVISKAEAQALNALRSENIQNNLRVLVDRAAAELPENTLLSTETLAELQAKLTEYDHKYQFVERHQSRGRVGDIEAEAAQIARERVMAEMALAEVEWEEPQIAAQVAQYEGLPAVIEEARQRVQAKRSVLSLADL